MHVHGACTCTSKTVCRAIQCNERPFKAAPLTHVVFAQVMAFSTSSADGKEDGTCGKLDIYTTGVLPFSVDVTSPGFQVRAVTAA